MRTFHPSRGSVLILTVFFLGIFLAVSTALLGYLTSAVRAARVEVARVQALTLAEGAIDKAVRALNQNGTYAGETNTVLGPGSFTVTVATIDSNTRRITATASVPSITAPLATRTIKATLSINSDVVSFHYGIQSGQGGFRLENSSSIVGNVFSSGSVIGTGNNMVYGDVVSAGPGGLVYGIHATSSVYAHTIGTSGTPTTIDKNAYYVTKTNTTVSGTSYPNSPDPVAADLPISDDQISQWEEAAAAGGTHTCSGSSYTISSGSVTLGPRKIPCDLTISNNAVVTLAGHVWVTGSITVQNSAVVRIDPSLGSQNVALIADKPSDRLTSSKILVKNTAAFENSGAAGSYVFLISQNNSAETGGTVAAIELTNSATGAVAYAAHGYIPLENTIRLKEATAYKIGLKNTAQVVYDTGLQNAVFQSGPGGSWRVATGTYAIIR